MEFAIAEQTVADHELETAMARLVPQLTEQSPPPDAAQLKAIVASPAVRLLCARDGAGRIVGTLSLILVPLPTGLRARIEDVVIDADARGLGVGQTLLLDAIKRARSAGARDLDLTSRPSRENAIRLYQTLGFQPRQTTVYRHLLSE